jgi:photosystem II stability/assembly factor-like uncharacterized protein
MHSFALPLFFAVMNLHWIPQVSPADAGLRGLSVVSEKIAWASGSKGTILRTLDGGDHWELRVIEGTGGLDFRDIVAFDGNRALAMSSGTGEAARVFFTRDGGKVWKLVLMNPDKSGFFDAMKFWDRKHGILLGDPVDGHFTIFVTADGGMSWKKATQPEAQKDEGAFAASGTCLTVRGSREAWFGSGGAGGGRVFHSRDGGVSWSVANTPLAGSVTSAGIFSVKFMDARHGIAVGGDYKQPGGTAGTIALTENGGRTWTVPATAVLAFRSGIAYLPRRKMLLAVGTSGSDYSVDGGVSWKPLSKHALNAVAGVWAVGPKGVILKLAFDQ